MSNSLRSHLAARLVERIAAHGDRHLTLDEMADLYCRKYRIVKRWLAQQHLSKCMTCRMRQEHLEGRHAARMLRLYSDSLGPLDSRLSYKPRAEFANWLALQAREPAYSGALTRRSTMLPVRRYAFYSACAGIVLGILGGSASYWYRSPNLSATAFLMRSEKLEAPSQSAAFPVVHQTIEIRTSTQRMERSLYWDIQGKRQPKQVQLVRNNEQLRHALETAGVNWEQPISAAAYQSWHDRQHTQADRVRRTGVHLLTLTTTVADGAVAEESLTVRDSDFHPVRRTVDFRTSGTVEIAEVDFKLLPWSAVGAGIFEPLPDASQAGLTATRDVVSPPSHGLHAPVLPSEAQLDEAELAARLILNQLHADSGEQIELHRLPQNIEVDGLVQTDERKRELTTQLMTVPRLKVAILSVPDLEKHPVTQVGSVSVRAADLPDNASALGSYLLAQGSTTDTVNAAAQHLFNSALAVSQETQAIADLRARFRITRDMTVVSSATLSELIYSHHLRLEAALLEERLFLEKTGGIPATERTPSEPVHTDAAGNTSLIDAARNLALSRELTQTQAPAVRTAAAIFADMSDTVTHLFVDARAVYARPEDDSTLNIHASGKR